MDHERVNISATSMSCGVLQLSRINSETGAVLYALASRLYHPARGDPAAFFVFSDVAMGGTRTSSDDLERAVKCHDFGSVSRSGIVENTKTGNYILVFTWAINHTKFKAWYGEERVKRLKKVGA